MAEFKLYSPSAKFAVKIGKLVIMVCLNILAPPSLDAINASFDKTNPAKISW